MVSANLRVHRDRSIAAIWKAIIATIFAGLACYSLFRLPFQFPPKQRLWSASYAFGFNNAVAIAALGLLLCFATLVYIAWKRGSLRPAIEFPVKPGSSGRRSCTITFAVAALLYTGLTYLMYLYSVNSAPWLMWETRHFLYRTLLMDVYKLRPYTDFQAEYGPILTYAPLYLYWLLKPLGSSHQQAYFVAHLLLNLGGLWCAYYLLSRTLMSAGTRVVAFSLVAIAGFAPYMGLNGVLLRYLCPFACLLWGDRSVARLLLNPKQATGAIAASVIVLLLLTANILLSSEAAAAFGMAWLSYALLMARRNRRILIVSIVGFVAAGLLCWLLLPAAYYHSLIQFSEGANNLPLLPAPHLLIYILTMFLVVPPLLASGVETRPGGDVRAAAICGAMGVLCLAMAPGALGRCDPPHVLFFGMGACLLLMIRLSNLSRLAFNLYALGYVSVFIVLMQLVNLQVFYDVPPKALLSRRGILDIVWKLQHDAGTEKPSAATLSVLDRYPKLGLPFATFEDPAVENYVLSHRQLDSEYYVSVVGIYSPAALQNKLRDLAKMEYLLVPEGFGSHTPRDPCSEYLKSLQQWFLYPANLPCRRDPLDPSGTVNSFIADHYAPVEQVGSSWVLRRVTNSSTATRN